MPVLMLDSKLAVQPRPPRSYRYQRWSKDEDNAGPLVERTDFVNDLLPGPKWDHATRKYVHSGPQMRPVYVNGFNDTSLYHRGYLAYLELCWANHWTAVISPDILWQIFLGELASAVKEEPETYRALFSESPDKQMVTVMTADPVVMPVAAMVDALRDLIPTDVSLFTPIFSTTTDMARKATLVSFCDLVSPYYEYSMYCCGIRAVEVLGTDEDWQLLCGLIGRMKQLFPQLVGYISQVDTVFANLWVNRSQPGLFTKMFALIRCGSGSQTEVEGWITKLYRKIPSVRYVSNYPTGLAKMDYKNLTTGQNFQMHAGLMSSHLEDDVLRPEFNMVVFEKEDACATTKNG